MRGRPRAAGRLARSPQLAAALAARLTARDRWLLRMLCEHRVLTTGQITQLALGTTRAATARLAVLYQYRAVDRFRPLAPAGSAPLHFILDEAGAMLLAAEDGITPGGLGYRRDRAIAIALSPRLAHDTGASGVFTALAAAARASSGQAALECLWGERRCAAAWGEHARPDGYGRWSEHTPGQPAATVDFFLEYDTGTEPLTRLTAKLAGYAALAARTGITTPVLFPAPPSARPLRVARPRGPALTAVPQPTAAAAALADPVSSGPAAGRRQPITVLQCRLPRLQPARMIAARLAQPGWPKRGTRPRRSPCAGTGWRTSGLAAGRRGPHMAAIRVLREVL